MLFSEYKVLTTRTLPDLGSQVLNSVHMSMGFASETYELFEGVSAKDKANIGEEIGDKLWYLANYINVNKLNLELEFITAPITLINSLGEDDSGASLIVYESTLLDYDKKWLAYGKEKNNSLVEDAVVKLFQSYNNLIIQEKLDASQIMSRNIAKLLVRFPDKFTQEDANHRDLVKEREVLEGK